ncbi:MAG: TolC family protein [Kofleriaceae bacterium]|nr:TolC family protein [Myxococcales bacterium]MCB9564004.1 TolC family protein [Kofleriaceae bacterium]
MPPSRSRRAATLVVAASLLSAAPAAADEVRRLDLAALQAASRQGPRARMAHRDTQAASARVDEADAARLPRITATGYVAPSPEIHCNDPDCTTTDPEDFAIRISGVLGGGSLSLTQPLYTFGKLTAVREAARAAVAAQVALEDELAGDLAAEAARAYWGLKLARELTYMLEDGIDEIDKAKVRLDERIAEGKGEATVQDRQRVETLIAEARVQLADARTAEATALAGVRAIVGDDAVDIDEDPLAAVEVDLGTEDTYVARARDHRPQVRAARAGADAAAGLTTLERGAYWPDLALIGSVGIVRAQGVDDAPSAVYAEPYNNTTGAIAVVLRWNLEPWTTKARVARAQASQRKAEELVELAGTGAALDAHTAWAEAHNAQDRLHAAEDGLAAAKAWRASVLQADALGLTETKDLADAFLAYFQMRARVVTAIFQWNVATVRLDRATGEFTRGP